MVRSCTRGADLAAAGGWARVRVALALCALVVVCVLAGVLSAGAAAEQASEPTAAAAAGLDAGAFHTCALVTAGVRCWGFGGDGQLGYGNTSSIGDDEMPSSVGPVDLGGTAKAISAGGSHTCALMAAGGVPEGSVRCWGFGGDGRLGYGNTSSIGDDEMPSSVGPVDLGGTAKAISAGEVHTCALLTEGSVRCWGFAGDGQLGYTGLDPNNNVGDNESPSMYGPVDFGTGLTATAISAGGNHTCALLNDESVRCWGSGANGQLGYGNTDNVLSPASMGPVYLGPDRKAKAISAGQNHTCAVLDDNTVRCWGYGADGELGYAGTDSIGDNELPGSVGPVALGLGAKAVSAGNNHTCAVLDDASVRCWGLGASGRLGYANITNIGDNEAPGSVGPVRLGLGRSALAISAGARHTCARLDDANVRCWGFAGNGRLGYCSAENVGDNETPEVAGPVALEPGHGCGSLPSTATTSGPLSDGASPPAQTPDNSIVLAASDAARARGLRSCLARVTRHARLERSHARQLPAPRRARATRHMRRHRAGARRRCLKRYGRTPGSIRRPTARALGRTRIELSFTAPGTDGTHAPPAHAYLVKQSLDPIRSKRDFARAPALCKGACRFNVTEVGGKIALTVTGLHPHTTYYYAVAARDNVSRRPGPRSATVKVTTR